MDLRHLVVEGDALVGRRLVGGEDAADDVGPRCRADVGQLLVPKRVLEVAPRCAIWWSNWMVSKSEVARRTAEAFSERCQTIRTEGSARVGAPHGEVPMTADMFLSTAQGTGTVRSASRPSPYCDASVDGQKKRASSGWTFRAEERERERERPGGSSVTQEKS
jgi:hypothetical protein